MAPFTSNLTLTASPETPHGAYQVSIRGTTAASAGVFTFGLQVIPSSATLQVQVVYKPLYGSVAPPSLNISRIIIDGQAIEARNLNGTNYFSLTLSTTSHSVEVPQVAFESDDVRIVFDHWSDGVESNPRNLTLNGGLLLDAVYKAQYKLTIVSDYGPTDGSGWYDERTEAPISVASPNGFLILHVFDHWEGIPNASYPSALVYMDEPKTVKAVWRDDYSQLIIYSTIVEVAIILPAVLGYRRLRRRKEEAKEETKVY